MIRNRLAGLVALVLVSGPVSALAQGQAQPAPDSLSTLVAEVRQLRLAIEESNREQSRVQYLAVYLSAQQSRLMQLNTRLDAVRTELSGAQAQSQAVAQLVAQAQAEAAAALGPEEREQAEKMGQMFKAQVASALEREQQVRNRESELAQILLVEEGRWTDLISRLEQSVKR